MKQTNGGAEVGAGGRGNSLAEGGSSQASSSLSRNFQ